MILRHRPFLCFWIFFEITQVLRILNIAYAYELRCIFCMYAHIAFFGDIIIITMLFYNCMYDTLGLLALFIVHATKVRS